MKKITISFALASILFAISCGDKHKDTETKQTPIAVVLSNVAQNAQTQFVNASGKIEAENSANLSTRLMGFVTKINAKVGDKVSAGQLLISINNSDLQAKKAQVEASILQASAAYNNAKKDYDRFVVLFKQQSASQKELDDITARYEMAKASLEGAKQMKNEVLAQFSYANITAPFSGVITNTFVKEGDMANPGMPLLSIEGAAKLQVMAMVSENEIQAIKPGMNVKVMVKSIAKELDAKVVEVSSSAKNTGGQYLVKIALNNSEGVMSGMFVNVQFPIESQNVFAANQEVLLVPVSALVYQGQLTGIYTIGQNNTAILRWLKIGKYYGEQVEVLSGLAANEKYILSAEGKLYNGALVATK